MLQELSTQIADVVASAGPSVVQVQGGRRPASGVVYADGVVLTTTRALGREEGLRVRPQGADALDAELAGWDPSTGLALLRVAGLAAPPIAGSAAHARVGELAVALARSWSNALTASMGIVSVIGGPLRTGRRHAIDEVIRTTAPMHEGFAGGAFVAADGTLAGVTTASEIRGLGVVIPAAIAWATAATLLEHGRLKRGYLGIAGQRVSLSGNQRQVAGREHALLLLNVTAESPAAAAGLLVGDVLLALDDRAIESPEDLLDLLVGDRVGRTVTLQILRGDRTQSLPVTVGERPHS